MENAMRLIPAVLLLPVLLVQCDDSSDPDTESGSGGGPDEERAGDSDGSPRSGELFSWLQATEAYAETYCEGYLECEPERFLENYDTMQDCIEYFSGDPDEFYEYYADGFSRACADALTDYAECLAQFGECEEDPYSGLEGLFDVDSNCVELEEAWYEACN
jgi:hypothetical protein